MWWQSSYITGLVLITCNAHIHFVLFHVFTVKSFHHFLMLSASLSLSTLYTFATGPRRNWLAYFNPILIEPDLSPWYNFQFHLLVHLNSLIMSLVSIWCPTMLSRSSLNPARICLIAFCTVIHLYSPLLNWLAEESVLRRFSDWYGHGIYFPRCLPMSQIHCLWCYWNVIYRYWKYRVVTVLCFHQLLWW